jgi:hypothetical protein
MPAQIGGHTHHASFLAQGLRNNAIALWQQKSAIYALENASVAHVEGVGILRMTHRAATEKSRV